MRSHSFSSYFFLLHFRFLSRPLFPAIMLRRFNGQKRQKKVKEKKCEKNVTAHFSMSDEKVFIALLIT